MNVDKTADLPYDYEDFGMSADQLQAKYDREHPHYTNLAYNDVIAKASDVEAQPAYWTWVVQQIAKDDDETPSTAEGAAVAGVEGQAEQAKPEIVRLDNVDLFAAHLVAWHTRKMAELNHFLNIPEGTEFSVKINEEEEKTITLSGDVLVAFRGGLATTLTELGSLPFVAIPQADLDQAQAALAGKGQQGQVATEAKDQAANG